MFQTIMKNTNVIPQTTVLDNEKSPKYSKIMTPPPKEVLFSDEDSELGHFCAKLDMLDEANAKRHSINRYRINSIDAQ